MPGDFSESPLVCLESAALAMNVMVKRPCSTASRTWSAATLSDPF